jgi:predicted ATPase/class 3 adenylate cyclase
MNPLAAYVPHDRRRALALGQPLPDQAPGAALFADVSGFTGLTQAITSAYGARRGAEELTRHLDAVYNTLIAEVERYGGSVVSFAGDAITCWFPEPQIAFLQPSPFLHFAPSLRAVAGATAMQRAMGAFAALALPNGETASLAIKTCITTGLARRWIVGDPTVQLFDAFAGDLLARVSLGERLAGRGEVLVDETTYTIARDHLTVSEWRQVADGAPFGVIAGCEVPPPSRPPTIAADRAERLESEQLRPWLLPPIYEREQAGQGAFITEFRPCVALFVRFLGIDYDTPEAGPQLDAFIRQVQQVVTHYSGTLLQLTIGDKGSFMYLVFGAPIAHEDEARRALTTAFVLQREVKRLGFIQPLQMGLSRGMLRTGAYGGRTRRTYGAIGDDVNLAARLMEKAAPGQVLISERLRPLVHEEWASLQVMPPVPIRGRVGHVAVFAVTRLIEKRVKRLQELPTVLPLVGRLAELAQVAEKSQLVLAGQGQLVGFIAEAGMGKSRLLAEVLQRLSQQRFTIYGGSCQADGTTTPYLVWQPIWQAFFGLEPTAAPERQSALLLAALERLAPDRVPALPLLRLVLNLDLPDNDFTTTLAPKERQSALEALLLDCLAAAARAARAEGRGLVLAFEDVHWLDSASQALLESVGRGLIGWPVICLMAYRPSDSPTAQTSRFAQWPHFTEISLPPLTQPEVAQLMQLKWQQVFPGQPIPVVAAFVQRLMDRTQGNPFYVEELLMYLRDQQVNWRDPEVLTSLDLPDSLHTLILSRIDRLSARQQLALKVASVIGRQFRFDHLLGYYPALGEAAAVKRDLAALAVVDITPLDTPEPELAYLFKHIVTREVAYHSLTFAMREELHEQYARYLETLLATPARLTPDLLAYHYQQTPNVAKQRQYLRLAAEAAQAAYANQAAVENYQRLFPLLAEDALAQAECSLQLAEVLELMGRWPEAEAQAQTALSLANGPQDHARRLRAQAHQALGTVAHKRGDYGPALTWLMQARVEFGALHDLRGQSRALIEVGVVGWRQGDYAAAHLGLAESLTLAQAADDLTSMALARMHLGNVAYIQGDYATARSQYTASLALFRQLNNKPMIASILSNLGYWAFEHDDYVTARHDLEESLNLRRLVGDRRGIAGSYNNLGNVAFAQGEYDRAREYYTECLAYRQEQGERWGIAALFFDGGLLETQVGHVAQARDYYARSLALSCELDAKLLIIYVFTGIANLLVPKHPTRAVRLAGAAHAWRTMIHGAIDTYVARPHQRALAQARAALGATAYTAAWESGLRLASNAALEEVWDYLTHPEEFFYPSPTPSVA